MNEIARNLSHDGQCRLVKVKGKVHPRKGQEGPQEERRYSSTLSLASALVEGWR